MINLKEVKVIYNETNDTYTLFKRQTDAFDNIFYYPAECVTKLSVMHILLHEIYGRDIQNEVSE